jgi:uncharacterized repeat protein (TIGR01451 family)
MKTMRLLLATGLALAALVGIALALTWWQPTTARAEDAGAAPLQSAIAKPLQEWWQGWYFKDPFTDYAPSGVPDFDQRQDEWGVGGAPGAADWQWTYCGPVAAANSLWWFDSKFEPDPLGPPPGGPIPPNDHYPLVKPYGSWDDHDPQNVGPFVNDLARYFDTDGVRTGRAITGTDVYSLATGIEEYITDQGLGDRYYVSMRDGRQPELMLWVYEEVMKSEDVILLLGFYEDQDGTWVRIGGHFVTAVGITQTRDTISVALSDPIQDPSEPPTPAWGRVRDGLLIPHRPPHSDATIHNDAGNVSHDFYYVFPGSPSPGGFWWIPDYPLSLDLIQSFQDVNPHPDPSIETGLYKEGQIHTEIEFAIAVSPMIWKAGYEDYAPSGVPDFDQQQDDWGMGGEPGGPDWQWTHDGPTAWANSFWWFDAKFNDEITRSRIVDYEHISTTVPLLVEDLARYAGTDQGIRGTSPVSLSHGIDRYLAERGLQNYFYRTTYAMPPFEWVVHEVKKSEDVLLLLGFWQLGQDGLWRRLGGHWVTVAGINGRDHTIAFSDPYRDWAEDPIGQGRVLPFLDHSPHVDDHMLHNDALYISHDVWVVADTHSPGGTWGPMYYTEFFDWRTFAGVNPHPHHEFSQDFGEPVVAEVEYAVAVSPMEMFWKGNEGYEDYAPNGIPDFDQKQDGWFNPQSEQWSYCGPVAAANSLWWFDSKFEPDPQTPEPGVENDHFPLVSSYSPGPQDDHDPANVGGMGPRGLVDELAWWMNTDDQQGTGSLHQGTNAADMERGIDAYLHAHGVDDQFYTKTVQAPTFDYVCEQVEQSEDVVLLIGFWEYIGDNTWLRYGGHYVTVAGVDRAYRHIAFSDPSFDVAEHLWSGRVLSGTLIQHYPPHPATPHPGIHNDAGNVSHDIYQVVDTLSPGGRWGPVEYAGEIYPYFEMQNDGMRREPGEEGEPGIVVAEVEWAFVVSPLPPDVTVHKKVTPRTVVPGDRVTYTIAYTNVAANWAENVVISDVLPSELVNPTWNYTTTYGKSIAASDTYTWAVGRLGYLEGGVITVTAQVDPDLAWPAETVITNVVEITATTPERTPDLPNRDSVTLTVQTTDVEIAKSVTPSTLQASDWLTYTIVYTNHGAASASSTVITDLLHAWLVNPSYDIWTSYVGAAPVPTGYYVWSMGDVPASGWGIITVTAQVSPSLSGGGTLPNAVSIGTATPERDTTNNDDSADATVVYYGVDLQPESGGLTENPDKVVTYTLTLYNTGNVDDNYTIAGSVAGESWTTNWPTTPIGPVVAGGSAQFDVVVQIPSGALGGDWSRATITATSQGDSYKWDTAVLTTTAYAGTITRDVQVTPISTAVSGDPGDTVCFTLTVTNTGTVADTLDVTHTFPVSWTVTFTPPPPYGLGPGESQAVQACITIPAGAGGGSTKAGVVTVASQGDPSVSADVDVTVHVGWKFIYLPIAMRTYSP